jgi:hypothetical protein
LAFLSRRGAAFEFSLTTPQNARASLCNAQKIYVRSGGGEQTNDGQLLVSLPGQEGVNKGQRARTLSLSIF